MTSPRTAKLCMQPLRGINRRLHFNPAKAWNQERLPFSNNGNFHTSERNIETTLNQLNALAKVLIGYPGRKNLIWLSESFPLDLFPDIATQVNMSGQDLRSARTSLTAVQSAKENDAERPATSRTMLLWSRRCLTH